MRKKQRLLMILIVTLLLMTSVIISQAFLSEVSAKSKKKLALNEKTLQLVSGQSSVLNIKSRPYQEECVRDAIWYSEDGSIASVDEYGLVVARVPGTTIIHYVECAETSDGYLETDVQCQITVNYGEYVLQTHQLTMLTEQQMILDLPSGVSIDYESNYVSNPSAYLYIDQIEETNQLSIQAYDAGKRYLDITFYDASGHMICMDRCAITVLQRGLDTNMLTIAKGKSYSFQVNGYDSSQIVSFISEHPEIASIDANGNLLSLEQGTTKITLFVRNEYGENVQYICDVYVSNPSLTETSRSVAIGCSVTAPLIGTLDSSIFDVKCNKEENVDVYGLDIYAKKEGTCIITYVVDGVELQYKVTVTNPSVKEKFIAIQKGKSTSITIDGTKKSSKVIFESTNPSVATISKKGKLTAKKNGTTTIQVLADGATLYVPVSVGNEKVVSALNYAMKVVGSTYSQAKRMEEGYYDCSSLTWRSYHTAGINFGNNTWAPTAASIAEYLVKHNKAVAYEEIPIDELKPGDLLFFAKGENGRYKNISHVAIYAGTLTEKDDWYGTYKTGLLLEAISEGVGLYEYRWGARNLVLIARPTK